jgi:hypothetical protein
MEEKSTYTCHDYREEMILLGLKRRLAQDRQLTAEEKEELVNEIHRLEESLHMK